jgi:aryl-alcohol dehydrogenase
MNPKSEAEGIKIQAAVLRKRGGPLRIESIEMEGPRDDEVLVRIVASGICHTDIAFRDQWVRADGALVLGHEGAGVVERVGKRVKGVKAGDHVVLSYQSCGRCPPCRRGRPTECEHFWDANFGFERLDGSSAYERSGVRGHFFGQSSFATHTLVTKRNIVKVSKDLPLELLAPLGCGIQTGAGTVLSSLKVRKGTSVAIFGTGAVGLSAVMASRIVGADPIIGVDIIPKRLKLALALGASHIIDSRKDDVAARIARITGRGVDHVLEITGSPKMYRLAVSVLNPNGVVAIFTGESGRDDLTEGRKTLSIIEGDAVPQRFIPRLIKLYQEGRFPFDRLLRFYPFSHINRAMADSVRGTSIKPVLRISDP